MDVCWRGEGTDGRQVERGVSGRGFSVLNKVHLAYNAVEMSPVRSVVRVQRRVEDRENYLTMADFAGSSELHQLALARTYVGCGYSFMNMRNINMGEAFCLADSQILPTRTPMWPMPMPHHQPCMLWLSTESYLATSHHIFFTSNISWPFRSSDTLYIPLVYPTLSPERTKGTKLFDGGFLISLNQLRARLEYIESIVGASTIASLRRTS